MQQRGMARSVLSFLALLVFLLPGGCRKQEAAAPAGTTPPAARAVAPPIVEVTSVIPTEVNEQLPGIEENIPYFDSFSWREFIALTWPAEQLISFSEGTGITTVSRGVPNNKAPYGSVVGPLVFQTWKNDYEIFLPIPDPPFGAPPSRWDSYAGPSPCVGATSLVKYQTYLASFSKYHGFNQAGRGVDTGPLIDQNHQVVRYQTAVNRIEYEFIAPPAGGDPSRRLYLRENLPGSPGSKNASLTFPEHSIEIKAAWRIMDGVSAAQSDRFFTTVAQVLDPVSGRCAEKKVGLVGLHIVNKTHAFPNWVWSTFEQIDNVPLIKGELANPDETPTLKGPYSFNDPSQPQTLSLAGEPIDKCTWAKMNPPNPPPAPTQDIRLQPIPRATLDSNKTFHDAIRSYRKSKGLPEATVWDNYVLTLTQWPIAKGTDTFPNSKLPDPAKNTANTTMETFFQKSKITTCMNCHSGAQKQGDDFVYFVPLGALPQPPPAECDTVNAFTSVMRTTRLLKGTQKPDGQDKVRASLQEYFVQHPPNNQ